MRAFGREEGGTLKVSTQLLGSGKSRHRRDTSDRWKRSPGACIGYSHPKRKRKRMRGPCYRIVTHCGNTREELHHGTCTGMNSHRKASANEEALPQKIQVRSWHGRVWCVLDQDAPFIRDGERILWRGKSAYFTDALRKARAAGHQIYLSTSLEFRLRGKS